MSCKLYTFHSHVKILVLIIWSTSLTDISCQSLSKHSTWNYTWIPIQFNAPLKKQNRSIYSVSQQGSTVRHFILILLFIICELPKYLQQVKFYK